MRYFRFLALVGALATSACTGSLQTKPNLSRTDRLSAALPGATYALPRLQYDLTVNRYIASCPDEVDDDGNPTRLTFAVEVKASTSYQPGESYAVDFSRLGGIARTGSFAIEWHDNGTLKSIGVQGQDQTGQIIQDLTQTALSAWSVAGTGTGSKTHTSEYGTAAIFHIQGTDSPPPSRVTHIACSPLASEAVHALNAQLGLLAKAKGEADEIRKATEAASTRASLKLLTKKDRERLSLQFERLDQLEANSRLVTSSLEKLKTVLGTETKESWSGNYTRSVRDQQLDLKVKDEELVRLARLLEPSSAFVPAAVSKDDSKTLKQTPLCVGRDATVEECLKSQLELRTNFATDEPIGNYCKEHEANSCLSILSASSKGYQDAGDNVSDRGIFVRDPLVGKVLVCRAFEQVCNLDTDVAGLEPSFIPQLGQLRFIPFVIRPFEGRTLNIEVAKDGRVTKLVYSTDRAMLAQLAATAANVAGQADAFADKRETRRRADEDYWHGKTVQSEQDAIDRLNRQIALKDAQSKLNDPRAALNAEVAELDAQRSLAEARRARLEAEQKLEALLKPEE